MESGHSEDSIQSADGRVLKCRVCGHVWVKRGEGEPRRCVNKECRSVVWNREMKARGGVRDELRNGPDKVCSGGLRSNQPSLGRSGVVEGEGSESVEPEIREVTYEPMEDLIGPVEPRKLPDGPVKSDPVLDYSESQEWRKGKRKP